MWWIHPQTRLVAAVFLGQYVVDPPPDSPWSPQFSWDNMWSIHPQTRPGRRSFPRTICGGSTPRPVPPKLPPGTRCIMCRSLPWSQVLVVTGVDHFPGHRYSLHNVSIAFGETLAAAALRELPQAFSRSSLRSPSRASPGSLQE